MVRITIIPFVIFAILNMVVHLWVILCQFIVKILLTQLETRSAHGAAWAPHE